MLEAFQDNQAITSTAWMIAISIIPSDLVRTGAILLGGVVCVLNIAHEVRPRVLIEKLHMRLLTLEGKLQAAIDRGIMAQSHANFTLHIERSMGRLRYRIFELEERTLLASGVIEEVKGVLRGRPLEIIRCLQDVKALEREIEINRAAVLKNRYDLWQ